MEQKQKEELKAGYVWVPYAPDYILPWPYYIPQLILKRIRKQKKRKAKASCR